MKSGQNKRQILFVSFVMLLISCLKFPAFATHCVVKPANRTLRNS